jgi:hypothetical protein
MSGINPGRIWQLRRMIAVAWETHSKAISQRALTKEDVEIEAAIHQMESVLHELERRAHRGEET